MNEYKVTKGFDDAGITVTAIDEKDARRIYRATHCPEEVRAAGEPEGKEFQQAVTDHRALKGKLAYYKELAQRIAHAKGK